MNLNLSALVRKDPLKIIMGMLRPGPDDPAHAVRGKRLLQLLSLLVAVAVGAGLVAFFKGHGALGTTDEISWGILIATYVFLVVSSTGLCLVSSLGHVFGIKLFIPLAKKAIFFALLTLCIGFGVIASELEFPFRLALFAVISPNFSAPIWWMGTLYGLYMLFIGVELYFLITEDHRKARIAGVLSIIAAVTAHSNLGAVFGLLHSRPYWYGPFLPIYFIASALLCGAAILMLIVYFTDYFENDRTLRPENRPLLESLGKLLALFIGIVIFFTTWKMITAVSGGYHKSDVASAILIGKMFFSFWGFEMLLGMIIPFGILLSSKRKDPRWLAVAAGLPMFGIFFMRYNFVYAGQMFSLRPLVGRMGEQITYSPLYKGNPAGFLSYTPSVVEVLNVAGGLSAAVLGYVLGSRVLKLQQEATHE